VFLLCRWTFRGFLDVPLSADRLCGLVVRVFGYRSEARVRFQALSENNSGSGTGSTQPREYN
jgi:hypothetical protein